MLASWALSRAMRACSAGVASNGAVRRTRSSPVSGASRGTGPRALSTGYERVGTSLPPISAVPSAQAPNLAYSCRPAFTARLANLITTASRRRARSIGPMGSRGSKNHTPPFSPLV